MQSTKRTRVMPVVVVVAPSPELYATCQKSAALAAAARVIAAPLDAAATQVATWRPFALIVPDAVYEFDPREFQALARDVRATLISVADPLPEARAKAALVPALREAARRWRSAHSP